MLQNNHLIQILKNGIDRQGLCIDGSSFLSHKRQLKTYKNRIGLFKDDNKPLVGK
jgi:hypothetical protein